MHCIVDTNSVVGRQLLRLFQTLALTHIEDCVQYFSQRCKMQLVGVIIAILTWLVPDLCDLASSKANDVLLEDEPKVGLVRFSLTN